MSTFATQLNITGNGFTQNGGIIFNVTATGGLVTSFSTTASSSGTISYTIPLTSINNIDSSSQLSVSATDTTTNLTSNSVVIPLNVEVVNPTLSYSGGTVNIQASTTAGSSSTSTSSTSSSSTSTSSTSSSSTSTSTSTTGTVIVNWSSGTPSFTINLYNNNQNVASIVTSNTSSYTFNNMSPGNYYAIINDSNGDTISTTTGVLVAGGSVTLTPGGNIPVFTQLMAYMPDGTSVPLYNYNPSSPPGTVVGTYQGSNIYQVGTGDPILGETASGYTWKYPLPFYQLQSTTPSGNNTISVSSILS